MSEYDELSRGVEQIEIYVGEPSSPRIVAASFSSLERLVMILANAVRMLIDRRVLK